MKKVAIVILIFLAGLPALAQSDDLSDPDDDGFQTIFIRKDGKVFVSGFGGPMMSFSTVGRDFAHLMGGGGGVVVNNFFFGGYGMGLTTPLDYKGTENTTDPDSAYNLEFGHGGFWVGYVIAPRKPIHLSLSAQFGWGALTSQLDYGYAPVSSENVFVITPVAELEMNFSHFFKVGLGTSISYVQGPGISYTPYTVSDFIKPSVFLTFKFGWFN